MSPTTLCPNGHQSADPDWCDTCGARLGAPPTNVPPAPAPTAGSRPDPSGSGAGSVSCPHCGAPNTADALFCEDCGYDFTTGQVPDPVPTATVAAVAPSPAGSTGPPSAAAAAAPPAPATADAGPAVQPGPPGWIVIVEVDPLWFELKGTLADQPCPPPSSSTIPLGLAVIHIGRSSQSKGIHPEIAMDSDTAVSRKHAQLVAVSSSGDPSADADAYAAIDLGSTNGTFVVPAGSEPDESIEPIDPGVSVPLADGDRVYIGAWSRLTIRNTRA
jgi:hypothetical protein